MTTPEDEARETRSAEVELEVPGTPEQVWEAIATGPGVSAWFVPTEVAGGEGGTIAQDHGGGMEAKGTITAWDPPHRFAYSAGEWQPTERATPGQMAVEFLVEARSGGTCVVHIVHGGFGTGDDWDRAFESVHGGWSSALRGLRLYLAEFPGEPCSTIAAGGAVARPRGQAWTALTAALGIPDAAEGGRVATSASGAPPLAGVVDRATDGELLLRIDEPGPGMAHIGAGGPGDQMFAFVRLFLFGNEAASIAAREEPAWNAWMDEHFPSEAGVR
jgi:uncharacterized protein YndB with AHSA1/START domain